MPYLRKDAPPHIPEDELIESLLSEEKYDCTTQALQDISDEERNLTNLVRLGKRTERIPGDPFGVWPCWTGNVAHPEDLRMFEVLGPICDKIIDAEQIENEQTLAIQGLLQRIPHNTPQILAEEMAEKDSMTVAKDTADEYMVSFRLGAMTVCLVHAKELDKTNTKSYDKSRRAMASATGVSDAFNEQAMSIEAQQYLMAQIFSENPGAYKDQIDKETSGDPRESKDANKSIFATLRSLAREKYWLDMTSDERAQIQNSTSDPATNSELETCLRVIQSNWSPKWNNGRWDKDHFCNYLMDQTVAEKVWSLVPEDIFVVVDKNLQVVFANIEKLADILFGHAVVDLLERAIDLWSFYNPLPFPETSRHVVDRYIRRIHPELDPSKATVETLPNAKMAVAHYGCWAHKGDPHGRNIWPTKDTLIGRMDTREMCLRLFPRFAKAVLGKTSSIIRFLAKPLDEDYYRECLEVFENLPDDARLSADAENWISLFALGINGYTQRHRDVGDIQGGLAGLVTLGRYKGANLCVPQLGVKVKYAPGACAIIRGNGLDHLVQDYSGPRFFVIGTNHETCKKHALRKMGRLPPLPPRSLKRKGSTKDQPTTEEKEEEMENPCINFRTDDFDEAERTWTNELIHGPAVLPNRGSSSSSSE